MITSPLDTADATYRDQLRARITDAVAAGARTLTALCRASEAAFPTAVLEVAREVSGAEDVDQWPHRQWPEDALGTEDAAVPSMPEPHPIDYEWRYTAETADALAAELAGTGGRIGCFGAPSVFVRLAHRGADVVLVDRNPGLRRHFAPALHPRMWTVDLVHGAPRSPELSESSRLVNGFDTILLDPPWYVDHTKAWLARALAVLRPGGRVVLTLFPMLVRPAAAAEREELLTTLRSFGSVRTLPFRAGYTTPLFEHETLSSFGLADLGQWRSGELVEVVVPDPQHAQVTVPGISEPSWERVQLGRQVVAIRHESEGRALPISILPVGEEGSFLLRSVSARDPIRRRATLWTSRNRAAIVNGTDAVLGFLRALEAGITPREALGNIVEPADRRALVTVLALVGW